MAGPPAVGGTAGRSGALTVRQAPEAARKSKRPRLLAEAGARRQAPAGAAAHMFSIITCPKPEQETCVAPSIRRAKS